MDKNADIKASFSFIMLQDPEDCLQVDKVSITAGENIHGLTT